MVYKKIEYREFNSLEEIVRWEELNLDKKYKAIRGDLIYSHDPTAQAILQYSGFLYRPLNYYGRISSNAIIRCGNKKYIKYITDLVEFMYDFPIPENIVTYRFIHRKDFSQLRIAARQEYGLVKGWTSLLEKGFTSTTLLPSKYLESYDCTYNTENSVCIKILVPKGSLQYLSVLLRGEYTSQNYYLLHTQPLNRENAERMKFYVICPLRIIYLLYTIVL